VTTWSLCTPPQRTTRVGFGRNHQGTGPFALLVMSSLAERRRAM
jgi:hypothetical protein